MTNISKFFNIYVSCPSNKKIVTTDGSLNNIAHNGNIELSSTLILEKMLYVPMLSINLVSVNKLSQDLNCKVTFYLFLLWLSGLEFEEED